ncbi:uncharacterized protein LOC110033038, partial [Phalaenopsis equestris]|uniref:uncharacterized protein LOC110033038 n=1 Tax=Phalaenopsis equestris TaxID=78828 RepID=UPI0009E26F2F
MALVSSALLSGFSTISSSSLCSSLQKFFISTSVLPPSSIPLHSQFLLLDRSSRHLSSTPSSFARTAHLRRETGHEDSVFPIISDLEDADKLREEDESLATESVKVWLPSFPVPKLTIKEKKELASYAHSLGKKLKCQQVGKSGVTPTVAGAMVEALEANELLKLKIHGSCPGELDDVIKLLENSTGS